MSKSKNVAFVFRHSFVIRLPRRSLGEGWSFVIRSMSFAASPRFRSSDRPNVGLAWAPKFLFHPNRIDQIAAATAVASTDRSTSRWKTKSTSKKGRGSAPGKTFNLDQPSL
jgi:hypothetical protein